MRKGATYFCNKIFYANYKFHTEIFNKEIVFTGNFFIVDYIHICMKSLENFNGNKQKLFQKIQEDRRRKKLVLSKEEIFYLPTILKIREIILQSQDYDQLMDGLIDLYNFKPLKLSKKRRSYEYLVFNSIL